MQNVACIVASMTPCFRLYAYIGSRLAAQNSGHTHAYSQWIKTYSGEDFQAQAAKMEDLLNLLAPANDQGTASHELAGPCIASISHLTHAYKTSFMTVLFMRCLLGVFPNSKVL